MSERAKVSVLIPCFNSADVIGDCLESVKWADEIVCCDSFSSDNTLEICRRYGARIIQHEYINSATQKNWAIPQVTHEWVLIVDTDERVTPELKVEILRVLEQEGDYAGFRIPRLNHCFGRPLRHGGYYPDYQLRLFKRDGGRYQPREVHAHVILDGRSGTLQQPFIHYGQRSVEQVMRTWLGRYTTWEAQERLGQGARFRVWELLLRPIAAFAHRYIWQRGFHDGLGGLMMAAFSSIYVFITYCKMWEAEVKSGKTDVGAQFIAPNPAAAANRQAAHYNLQSPGGGDVNG